MDHPVYVEFPDAQVEGVSIWVKSDSIVIIVPGPKDGTCTLMLSTNLDAGVEVALPAQEAIEKINEAIVSAKGDRYYLSLDNRMYNAEAT